MNISSKLLQIITDIQTQLNDETALPDTISVDDMVHVLQGLVRVLLEMCQINKSLEYDQLEKLVQKYEHEIRQHVRLEQQMKLFTDSLQERIDQLETEMQELVHKTQEQATLNNQQASAIKELERKLQSRDQSPSLMKKSYIMGNQVFHQSTRTTDLIPKTINIAETLGRERRSAGTQHFNVKQLPKQNMSREQRANSQSQNSQEKTLDKSQQLHKSQNSFSYIKMYNIQKLIIKKQQEQQLSQVKSKTVTTQQLDESHFKKK